MTAKVWKQKVASLGCVLCRHLDLGETPAILHHVREGQGMSQRASDWLVVPLCPVHHADPKMGIHGAEFYQRFRMDEMDLLALTLEAIAHS